LEAKKEKHKEKPSILFVLTISTAQRLYKSGLFNLPINCLQPPTYKEAPLKQVEATLSLCPMLYALCSLTSVF